MAHANVNGDAFGDLLIGAPGDSTAASAAGRAFLYLGSATGPGSQPDWDSSEEGQAGAGFGGAVARAGDLNRDQNDDFLVGAYAFDTSNPDAGKAYLYFGTGSGVCDTAGAPCDDGSACTKDDLCDAEGQCHGTPYTCDNQNPCILSECRGDGTCSSTVLTGVACEDGDLCTQEDACHDGVCEATPKDCAALGDRCNLGACDSATGICRTQPIPDGRQCDDGDPCTTGDSCQKGVCLSTNNTCKDEGCGCGSRPAATWGIFALVLLMVARLRRRES